MERPGNKCKSIKNTSLAEQHEGNSSGNQNSRRSSADDIEGRGCFLENSKTCGVDEMRTECLEQLVCDPSAPALCENLVKWRMASCLGKDSLYHAEERGPTTG